MTALLSTKSFVMTDLKSGETAHHSRLKVQTQLNMLRLLFMIIRLHAEEIRLLKAKP